MIRGRVGRVGRGGALLVALALTGVGCGSSDSRYVKNADFGLFLRIPSDWESVRLEADQRPDPVFPRRPWQVLLDDADQPDPNHLDAVASVPVGLVEIVELVDLHDGISLEILRVLSTTRLSAEAFDPVAAAGEATPGLEIIRYMEQSDADYWGSRLTFSYEVQEGDWVTIDQLAMVDNAAEHLYRLTVRCSSSCYTDHQSEIDRIFDSWTLEKP